MGHKNNIKFAPSCVTSVGSSWTEKCNEKMQSSRYTAKCSTRLALIRGTVAKIDETKTHFDPGIGKMGQHVNLIDILGHTLQLSASTLSRRLAIGDIDGDGFVDIVVSRHLDNLITWFRNLDGDGFSVGGNIDAASPTGVAVADLDGDGNLDVIFNSATGGELTCC